MNFAEYQGFARETAVYPDVGHNITYAVLGLCGEAGEVAEKVKKAIRDDHGTIHPERKEAIKKELGDLLWYIAATCSELDISLEDVATGNLNKLASRAQRGVLKGSGDNR